jgi:tRNA pseudouridine38-40 synthase
MIEPAQSDSSVPNWKLTLSYDGTDFSGWQIQPGQTTIQGELQAALGRVTGEAPLPQGSGRTDAGVHALAQVASFQLHAPIPPGNLRHALNKTLPAAIRVLDAEIVPAAFHARHSAVAKTYEYRVLFARPSRGEVCPPFLARYVYAWPWPLNIDELHASALPFLGEHDFLSFAATDPDLTARAADQAAESQGSDVAPAVQTATRTTVRTIFSSAWHELDHESGQLLVYRVRGSGFLHHMVRNIVGTMLDVARSQMRSTDIPAMIDARSRSAAGPTAPARGLFLHSVEYGQADTPARASSNEESPQ